jgi:hypothetical protein
LGGEAELSAFLDRRLFLSPELGSFRRVSRDRTRSLFSGDTTMRSSNSGNTKLVFLLCVLALAAVAVLFASKQWPPVDENVSGTIMPAERYQEDQISEEDVVLGDESVAKIMQTDEFEQYRNGQAEVAAGIDAAADDARSRAAADDARKNFATDDARARAAADDARKNFATDDARARAAADDARARAAADDARARAAADDARARAAADDARARAAADDARSKAADGAKRDF